jgi:hypothetical protein
LFRSLQHGSHSSCGFAFLGLLRAPRSSFNRACWAKTAKSPRKTAGPPINGYWRSLVAAAPRCAVALYMSSMRPVLMGGLTWPCHNRVLPPVGLRWSRRVEQFGGLVKLSASIGRFLKSAARAVLSAWPKKDRQQSCPGTLCSFSPAVAGSHSVPADRVQTIGARPYSQK